MAFTTGNVSVPASGGGVVLVYQTSNSVPVNVALSVDTGGELYLLHGSGQTPSTGFRMSAPTVMHGFVGSIYAAGLNSAYTLSFAVSSVEQAAVAVGSKQFAITSTASVIASAPAGLVPTGPAAQVWLFPDASAAVFIGGSNVSSSNGLKIPSAASPTAPIGPFTLFAGDVLYAVTASTATLGVLQT